MNPATTTAPPTTSTISLPKLRLITASPVCRPGLPALVALDDTPALPVGVSAAVWPAATTVTAVTTDLLPFGKVLVWTTVLVCEDALLVFVEVVAPDEGVRVVAPPPTVETTVRPTPLVVVTTCPAVREIEAPAVLVLDVEDPPALVLAAVVNPDTGEPFEEETEVDIMVDAELGVAPGEVVELWPGLVVVEETFVVGLLPAGVLVVDEVPFLAS